MSRSQIYDPLDADSFIIDTEGFDDEDFPSFTEKTEPLTIKTELQTPPIWEDRDPIITPEEEDALKKFYNANPKFRQIQTDIQDISHNRDDAWIQTYSGKKFHPLNPKEEDICIKDIAHSLSMQCRFTGHSLFHYSVAQHSVLVSYLCDKKYQLYGLLHDGSEAYIGDLNTPLKRLDQLKGYRTIEANIQKIIYNKFNLDEKEPKNVKEADLMMLGIEAKTLLSPIHPDWKFNVNVPPFLIMQMSSQEAEKMFLDRFNELYYDE